MAKHCLIGFCLVSGLLLFLIFAALNHEMFDEDSVFLIGDSFSSFQSLSETHSVGLAIVLGILYTVFTIIEALLVTMMGAAMSEKLFLILDYRMKCVLTYE